MHRRRDDDSARAATGSVRGGAPSRSPNVRVLAGYTQHLNRNLDILGFASGVNFDRLLAKFRFQMRFGQSPLAIATGLAPM
jgi:hypothetical protein